MPSSSSTPDNFIRAETDLYFSRIVADNGFGKFTHNRELIPQTIGNFLPTHAAILALRGVILGSTIAVTGVLQLAAWLVVGALASVLITGQRRALNSKQLRLGSALFPAT